MPRDDAGHHVPQVGLRPGRPVFPGEATADLHLPLHDHEQLAPEVALPHHDATLLHGPEGLLGQRLLKVALAALISAKGSARLGTSDFWPVRRRYLGPSPVVLPSSFQRGPRGTRPGDVAPPPAAEGGVDRGPPRLRGCLLRFVLDATTFDPRSEEADEISPSSRGSHRVREGSPLRSVRSRPSKRRRPRSSSPCTE